MEFYMHSLKIADEQQSTYENKNEDKLSVQRGRELYKKEWDDAKKNGGKLRLYPESGYELMQASNEKVKWVVENLVAEEAITIISALPNCYKTWLFLDMAVKVAKGEPVFGKLKTKQSGVLIINEESTHTILKARLSQLGWTPDLPIFSLNNVGYKLDQIYADAIIATAKERDVKFIIFDSFVRFNAGDENDSGAMAKVMDLYKQIALEGFGVLIVHHNRKGIAGQSSNPALDMRGSVELLAAVDCHYGIVRKTLSDYITLIPTKNRLEAEASAIRLRFPNGASEFEFVGADKTAAEKEADLFESVLSLVRDNPGASQSTLIDESKAIGIKAGEKAIPKLLKELERQGKVVIKPGSTPRGFSYHIA
jgi:AAA domain